jgi:hypothetical protein
LTAQEWVYNQTNHPRETPREVDPNSRRPPYHHRRLFDGNTVAELTEAGEFYAGPHRVHRESRRADLRDPVRTEITERPWIAPPGAVTQRSRKSEYAVASRLACNRYLLEVLWHCLTRGVRYDEAVHIANRNKAMAHPRAA